MEERSRLARAALLLAGSVFAATLARNPPPAPACPEPGESASFAGHSIAVACRNPLSERPVRGPARLLVGLPIDPNVADAATLETLPGIGPARAQAIVAERARGRFRSEAELTRVPGIGPRTLAGIAAWIEVAEPAGAGPLGPGRPDRVGCAEGCEWPQREGDS
jgi:hypothetical protein